MKQMRYGEYKFGKTCRIDGVILMNDKGDNFTTIVDATLNEYRFINERTQEVITVKFIAAEEEKTPSGS